MKIFIGMAAIMMMAFFEKDKTMLSGPLPAPVAFVILDKDGHNLITSKEDVIAITFDQQGIEMKADYGLSVVRVSPADHTPSEKYRGFYVACNIRGYSINPKNRVTYFNLSLNGKKLGIIHFDCIRLENGSYRINAFEFNNKPVETDHTVSPDICLLKME